jgi:hypothetical protein
MNRTSVKKVVGILALAGIGAFIAVVIVLHFVQPGYNASSQLMSELALGPHGSWMFIAFAGFALAAFSVQLGLGQLGAQWPIRALLVIASLGLLGAGVFRLGQFDLVHISLVTVAFIALVLSMCLFARSSVGSRGLSFVSWVLAATTSFSVAAGHSLMPLGVSQRLGAGSALAWLLLVALCLVRSKQGKGTGAWS